MATVSATYAVVLIAAVLAAGLFVPLYIRYQRDIHLARARVSAGSRMVETPCGPIEYAVVGDGPPVLVVHGAGGGYDQGLDIAAPLLGGGYRIIAMSRFGYLRTPLPADGSAAAQADAHACLLDALNIRHAIVIGASAGAPSAMQFALRHPERTAALVLMVPAAYAPRPMDVRSRRIPAAFEFLLDAVLKADFLFWALTHFARKTAIRTILGTPPAVVQRASDGERASVARMLDHILPISPRRLGLVNDAAIVSSLPRYELEQITAPTLIMSVADDLYGTFDGARYSAEHIPHARFVGYPSGGHMGVGHENETASEITAFLKTVEVR
jgi:pimeloyl-ACP methyl ester carboxylesterase